MWDICTCHYNQQVQYNTIIIVYHVSRSQTASKCRFTQVWQTTLQIVFAKL